MKIQKSISTVNHMKEYIVSLFDLQMIECQRYNTNKNQFPWDTWVLTQINLWLN